ncbi:MAG: M3 family oligoendopeptidase [Clostridiales bacterium]|nr:M3 family oligoendopeptidase [Clostridiales bacterium]
MKWDLTKLYASFDDPQFAADVQKLKESAESMLARARAFDGSAEQLVALIRDTEALTILDMKVGSFAYLTVAADASNAKALAACDKLHPINNITAQFYSALSAKLGEIEDLEALIASDELLRTHAYLLRKMKTEAGHVIDPVLEPVVLKMQMTGGTAWSQLRGQLDSGLMIDFEEDGKTVKLPLSAIRGKAFSADPDVRRRAYEAEIAAYPRMDTAMAACLNGIKGEALTMAELKKYDSVLDMALATSNMDRATLDALLAAMKESLPMFRKYLRLKAKMLGYEGGLKFYDLFAPMGSAGKTYSPEEARNLMVEVLGAFSPRMGNMINRAFDERWIDLFPREGKRGGAFCSGIPPLGFSYVLTNYEGSYSSVSTLAHELGHAYHNECMRDVPVLLTDYPMPLAETASIFNETLMGEKILQTADKDMQITMIEQQLSDGAQVIVDILSRFLFEYEVVEQRKERTLSPADLREIMLNAQKETYGDGLDPDCMHPYMWACKPHYYSTGVHFYNFPYAFGQLFALGVYALYEEKGAEFLPDYEKLLQAAGNGDVREVAASVGIDVTDVNFWRSSLKFFEDKLALLEKLVG